MDYYLWFYENDMEKNGKNKEETKKQGDTKRWNGKDNETMLEWVLCVYVCKCVSVDWFLYAN